MTQFYGYSKEGDDCGILYDVDWEMHTYFLSSQETGFEVSMLTKFDTELLIGQVSYKQKAEIYNICNGYDAVRKERKNQTQPSFVGDSTPAEQLPEISERCKCVVLHE